MPDFHLALTLNAGVLIVAIPAAVLIAAWSYRYSIPPISRTLKTFLVVLRSLALLFIFLLLGEPLLSLLMHSMEEPIVAVLIDNSKSMSIQDRRGDRKQILADLLESPPVKELHSIGVPQYVLFDLSSKPLAAYSRDSLTATGDGTDIGSALQRLKEFSATKNLQAAVLLSDGEFTVGANPLYEAEQLALPVFAVGIGDSSEQKDLLVSRVLTNDITYVGNRVPVNVTLKSSGYNEERTEVTLRQGGAVLDQKTVTLQPGTREYAVSLSFIPAREGVQKFTVDVSRLPGELTAQNNTITFFTKVLKSKMKVLLVAGSPNQDVAFIRRALAGDQNVELKSLIEQKSGDFYGGPLNDREISDADCMVLIDYPNATTSRSSLSLVQQAVDGSKPFLFVLSRTIDFDKLHSLEAALPFVIGETTTNEYQTFIAIPDPQRGNSILRLTKGSIDGWSKLAPAFRIQSVFRAKPESEILGTVRIQSVSTADPFFVTRNVNHKKSFAVLGYGLWRWKMYSEPGSGTENLLDEFLSNTVRWLTTREDDRRFKVQPVKSAFGGQEPIEFTGQVYDQNYQPIDNTTIQVTISHGKETTEITLNPLGNGQYDGVVDHLNEGDYSFTAKEIQNGKQVADDKGTFSVGGLNIEFLNTRMNKVLLQQIAARTGGKYYDTDVLGTLPRDISALPNFKSHELTNQREFDLWNSQWALTLIIVLLAMEWFIRKRNGMI